jgi:hypothetical protein
VNCLFQCSFFILFQRHRLTTCFRIYFIALKAEMTMICQEHQQFTFRHWLGTINFQNTECYKGHWFLLLSFTRTIVRHILLTKQFLTFSALLNTFFYLICDWQSMKSFFKADIIDWLSIMPYFHIRNYICDWPGQRKDLSHSLRPADQLSYRHLGRRQRRRSSHSYLVNIVNSTF